MFLRASKRGSGVMIVQDMRQRDAPPRLIGVRDTGFGGGVSCELRECSDGSLGSPRKT